MNLAPIILFVYNRPWHTEQTLESLMLNELADQSTLYIYSDGPKKNASVEDLKNIKEVRTLICKKNWCKEVVIIERDENLGLANSVIQGVTEVIDRHGKVIVLEDDIVTGKYFLKFMNDSLHIYEKEEYVFGVSGYKYPSISKIKESTYFLPISSSWSYATWADRWNEVNFNATELSEIINKNSLRSKMNFGNYQFYEMLQDQIKGKINSWAIRFYTSMFLENGLFLFPSEPLVANIGFDNSGTHCNENSFFKTPYISDEEVNILKIDNSLNTQIVEKFRKSFSAGSIKNISPKKNNFYRKRLINFWRKLKFSKEKKLPQLNLWNNIDQNKKLLLDVKIQNGRIWTALLPKNRIDNIQDAEFKVFSQWGDDGIIQYLINSLDIENKKFVEFGVEDYMESNTRFLLMNDNWSGLVMDGSKTNVAKIKEDEIYWKYDLTAKSAFITVENVNQLIEEEGISGEIGLLHIDIDGNDYWIWKALTIVKPIIMIVEYNSVFGYERAITISYDKYFDRTKAHYSNLYAGTSILSLCDLAEEKGYKFIGSNSAGNNAYFVKKETLNGLKPLSAKTGYVESKFRESRDGEGALTYIRGKERIKEIKGIKGMEVFNTRSNKIEKL